MSAAAAKDIDEDIRRLGYDPDEVSDCSLPPTRDLKQKKDLLNWRYLEGGHRLPWYIPLIPHVDEKEIFSSVAQDEEMFAELAKRLAGDAKQVMMEYVYAKQKFDTLLKERDLLKWHIANNSKVMRLKEAEAIGVESLVKGQDDKLKALMFDNERLERERSYLSINYKRDEVELEERLQSVADVQKEMEGWLSRRGDYIADTTVERRQANHERRLRYRQRKKLARACAVDKKWHVRIDAARNTDNMIFDAYESTANMLIFDFNKAEDVTGPIRAAVMEQIDKEDPFEGFQPTDFHSPTTVGSL